MAIDVTTEKLSSIPAAARTLPGRPHVATVWRWVYHGARGVKLETVVIGGRRYTSSEALQRFIERTSAVADGVGVSVSTRTAKQRQRAIEAAERELAAAGI